MWSAALVGVFWLRRPASFYICPADVCIFAGGARRGPQGGMWTADRQPGADPVTPQAARARGKKKQATRGLPAKNPLT